MQNCQIQATLPLLDYYESRFLMVQVSAMSATSWMSASSWSRPDADKAVSLYASALEADPSLADRREVFDDLVSLFKVFRSDPVSKFDGRVEVSDEKKGPVIVKGLSGDLVAGQLLHLPTETLPRLIG